MRKLTLALAVGSLIAALGVVATPRPVAAAYQPKVVIVVGQTQSATPGYINDANGVASKFTAYGAAVTKVYSPNATWAAVKAAAQGANVFIYMGHGSGYPNPYYPTLQANSDNGMGLDGAGKGVTHYYGQNYMGQLGLAPNALVILNHLCYASGDNEWMTGKPSVATAHTRIDGYASGFIRGGAAAVLAEGMNDLSYYIDSLFTTNQTVDAMWKSSPSFNNHVVSWASTWSSGYTSESDPQLDHPEKDGDVYYRSMVSIPSTTMSSIISGHFDAFSVKSGSYTPVTPTRYVDTRSLTPGFRGTLTAGGGYNFKIAGKQVGSTLVPSAAVAITANVTVTNATANGWIFLGPSVSTTPTASTVNVRHGDNRANGVTVALSSAGTVGAYWGAPGGTQTNLIIDVTGYFLPGTGGAGYNSFGPKRVFDTRPAPNYTDPLGGTGPLVSGSHRNIKIAGVQGLPASGIVAVTGNLTVVSPTASGYLYLGPDKTNSPSSSTINFPAHDTRANNVVVPLNADGTLSAVYIVASGRQTVEALLDITGYFTAAGGYLYNTLNPARVMDTRSHIGTGITPPFVSRKAQTLQVTGHGVPSGAVAISANLTNTNQTAAGFAAVGPTINASTNFSNLNFTRGDVRANGVTVPLAANGSLQVIYVAIPNGATTQLILDVSGYYMGSA